MEGIGYYFGDSAFTPVDKAKYFPDRWPTTRELLSLNKKGTPFHRKTQKATTPVFTPPGS